MLNIRIAHAQDLLHIESLGNSYHFENVNFENILENAMIAYDGDVPLAAAGYEAFGSVAVLRFVIVHKDHQREYLGDGIVKALLNLADKRGIQLMLAYAEDYVAFFKKVGFEELSDVQKNDSTIQHVISSTQPPQSKLYAARLPDFFLKACRSNK